MKAIRFDSYGPPEEVCELRDVPEPVPGRHGMVVRVIAAGLNPADWHVITGTPRIARLKLGLRPRTSGLGSDLAGVVEEVATDITGYRPGDAVFGQLAPDPDGAPVTLGAVAERARVRPEDVQPLPEGVAFEEAAGVGIAGTTALRAIRMGRVGPDSRVLVVGASGGVGHLAVQLAADRGAHVVGVCSTRNVDLVHSLGAAEVVDYTAEQPTRIDGGFDLILDNAGSSSPRTWRRLLARDGTYLQNFGAKEHRWFGPLGAGLVTTALGTVGSRDMRVLPTRQDPEELAALATLLGEGRVRVVVGRTYALADAAAAMREVAGGHARGKIVITVQET